MPVNVLIVSFDFLSVIYGCEKKMSVNCDAGQHWWEYLIPQEEQIVQH